MFEIKEVSKATWPDFVRVMEKHNGVWNGCWCVTFHLARGQVPQSIQARRDLKEELVKSDRSHAALVYEGADIVGWCQFGAPSELPARMGGFSRLGATAPDWRITCFFVDRDHRRQGVAEAALTGALRMIATQGGGTVDAYPIATRSRPYSSSFLWGGTESMFEDAGFRVLGSRPVPSIDSQEHQHLPLSRISFQQHERNHACGVPLVHVVSTPRARVHDRGESHVVAVDEGPQPFALLS